jgi:hypothetical protein
VPASAIPLLEVPLCLFLPRSPESLPSQSETQSCCFIHQSWSTLASADGFRACAAIRSSLGLASHLVLVLLDLLTGLLGHLRIGQNPASLQKADDAPRKDRDISPYCSVPQIVGSMALVLVGLKDPMVPRDSLDRPVAAAVLLLPPSRNFPTYCVDY